ncbi:MAG: Crp/Fnr family transcriptional regulator [Bacteriovoracaceae bacterium]
MSDLIKLAADKYLIREGEESSEMYYLQSGTMAVYKHKGGTEVQIGTIYSGEILGEMSFLDRAPRCASVKTISDCELVVIQTEKFEQTLKGLPKWYHALIKTLLDRLRRANARIKI